LSVSTPGNREVRGKAEASINYFSITTRLLAGCKTANFRNARVVVPNKWFDKDYIFELGGISGVVFAVTSAGLSGRSDDVCIEPTLF